MSHKNTIIFLTLKAIMNLPSAVIFFFFFSETATAPSPTLLPIKTRDLRQQADDGVDTCPSRGKQQTTGSPGPGGRADETKTTRIEARTDSSTGRRGAG